MPAIVRDRGISDQSLTRRADHRKAELAAILPPQSLLRFAARRSGQIGCRFESNAVVIDNQNAQPLGAADDDQSVVARFFAGDRKGAAGQRVVDSLRQRALANNREFGRRRQRAADQRAENKSNRRLGHERIHARRARSQ